MLWTVLINPILLVICGGLGVALCRISGANPHIREMSLALTVFIIASQAALIPLVFRKNTTAMSATQSALVGMVIHLLLAVVLAMLIMVMASPNLAFAGWTLLFYWATLGGLSFVFIRAVRSAVGVPQA